MNEIKKIRTAANIGLYGSLLLCIATVAEHYLSKYVWVREITTNDYTRRLFLMVGLVLAVGEIAMALFAMRKQTPRLRQMDTVDEKLSAYRRLVGTIYYSSLFVVLVVSAIIVITHENTMIMLLLLLFVTLVLNYPNMYKMKADMGLLDDEMAELFGSNYIRDKGEGSSTENTNVEQ
ncbi:MAG: hypothetical protein IKJ40_02445 [Bacteroidales bacterium]|nr:hypothetical protein [Bacteroidales bacterium]